VQRLQIRRIERDCFETDQLVKKVLNALGVRRQGPRGSGSRSPSGLSSQRRSSARSLRRPNPESVRVPERIHSVRRGDREIFVREVIRRGRSLSPPRPPPPVVEPSNSGRTRNSRYETEITASPERYVDSDGIGQHRGQPHFVRERLSSLSPTRSRSVRSLVCFCVS
jgi:hypothetical protein